MSPGAWPSVRAHRRAVTSGTLPPAVRWRDRGLTLGGWAAFATVVVGFRGAEGLAGPGGWSSLAVDLGWTTAVAAGVVAFLVAWGLLERRRRRRGAEIHPDPVALGGVSAAATALGIEPARLRAWRRAPVLRILASPEGRVTPGRPAAAAPPDSLDAAG